jgi:hypothetical protein
MEAPPKLQVVEDSNSTDESGSGMGVEVFVNLPLILYSASSRGISTTHFSDARDLWCCCCRVKEKDMMHQLVLSCLL